jgi:hypothetical protein
MAEEEMTQEQAEEYIKSLGVAPTPEEKHSVHSFLHKVATSDDTTKLGNLKEEEVGIPRLPLRTYKELALFCRDVADMDYYADYFDKKAEILTATSLSKEGFLAKLAVITRREQTNVLKAPPKENKGWFKKKNPVEGGVES